MPYWLQNIHDTQLFSIQMTYSNVSGNRTEKKRCQTLKLMGVEIGNPRSVNLTEPLKSNAEFDETPIQGVLFALDSDDIPVKSRRNLCHKRIDILRIAVYDQFDGPVWKIFR